MHRRAMTATDRPRPASGPSAPVAAFRFGTKAETLDRLGGRIAGARIPELCYFSVAAWTGDRAGILDRVCRQFGAARLAVRSSATCEDDAQQTLAGAFHTCLRVDGGDPAAVAAAVEAVIASYAGDPADQVLVQRMLSDVAMSGVVMTHDIQHGAPFYTIEYDDSSGKTDTITGGTRAFKAVQIFRHADPGDIESGRIARVLALARELEAVCGNLPLDIEFAMDGAGALHLLQVRRIGLQRNWLAGTEKRICRRLEHVQAFVDDRARPRPGLCGARTILGIMPDWNPAEIIGVAPRPLAASLYRHLITRRVWSRARELMGYRRLPAEELMVMIGGRPYIDVRNSFNSFLPDGLPAGIGNALVDAWLDRLDARPELHDKVEFEVATTCLDFDFDARMAARYPGLLGAADLAAYRGALTALTRRALDPGAGGTLARARAEVAARAAARGRLDDRVVALKGPHGLHAAVDLIRACRRAGTLPFAIVARHAFIAEALLGSAVRRGALAPERLRAFKRSVRTVMGDLAADFAEVCRGAADPAGFLARYGHLRPGTYDIMSPRYDRRDDLFDRTGAPAPVAGAPFAPTAAEAVALDRLLAESGLDGVDAAGLMAYARAAIAGREYAKFRFSQYLSDALEALADWGEYLGLSRDDLSYLPFDRMRDALIDPVLDDADLYFLDRAERGRRAVRQSQALKLGYLIRDRRDLYVLRLHRSAPNFVGDARVEGRPALLQPSAPAPAGLHDRIVCIENADPGYDWIFTRGIKGLVTKFGGANSHMAIRCAEFGLPAAIGCGEKTFERLSSAALIEIDPAAKLLRPVTTA